MRAFLVVEREVRRKAHPRLSGRLIIGQIHFFVLHRAPQALREDVVHEAPAPVHRDTRSRCDDAARVPLAGEMAALVAVDDLGHRPPKRGVGAGQNERQFQSFGQLPRHDQAREPVQERDQVQKAAAQTDIGKALVG